MRALFTTRVGFNLSPLAIYDARPVVLSANQVEDKNNKADWFQIQTKISFD